jgi:hypothetical protein
VTWNECKQCQINQKSPASAPLHPWEWPKRPSCGPCGPFPRKYPVDCGRRTLQVDRSHTGIIYFICSRNLFVTHGIPECLLTTDRPSQVRSLKSLSLVITYVTKLVLHITLPPTVWQRELFKSSRKDAEGDRSKTTKTSLQVSQHPHYHWSDSSIVVAWKETLHTPGFGTSTHGQEGH